MTFLSLVLLMSCRLDPLTDGGRLYTAWSATPSNSPCGTYGDIQLYCLLGECIDASTRTCRGGPCELNGRLRTYDAYDGDICPIYGGNCTSGDYCDPRRRGCISTTSSCEDEIEDF